MTLDLDALQRATQTARELQMTLTEIAPLIESLHKLGDLATLPTDRLIRAGEAAKVLGVGESTIGQFVRARLLKPYYVNSDQRRFWLSDVRTLAREKPWAIGGI